MSDIINDKADFFIDDHAVIFGLVAKHSEETLGDKGLETCGRGVILMGRERGLRSAKRCIANGDELTIKNYLCYAELLDSAGRSKVEINAYSPTYHTTTHRCGWYDVWKKYELEKYSPIYCMVIDKNIVHGFNPQLQLEMDKFLPAGDGCCVFRWIDCSFDDSAELDALMEKRAQSPMTKNYLYATGHFLSALYRVLCLEHGLVAGDIIQRPVYYPFTSKIEGNNRVVANSPLIRNGNTYVMDYEDLEKKFADPKNKGMIFCSPHNPVGRVWTEEELLKMVSIAKKYDKWIISDEIHCDLTRVRISHTPLLKAAPEYKDRIIVCTAPSKTFNMAGIHFSNIIIPNPEYQKKWTAFADGRLRISACNPFGLEAFVAAYTEGEEWLERVREYIDSNIQYIEKFVSENLPYADVISCEATYLVWLDVRKYCSDHKELEHAMVHEAKVALDEGYIFGEEGIGYERINVATPKSNIIECMERMKRALNNLHR